MEAWPPPHDGGWLEEETSRCPDGAPVTCSRGEACDEAPRVGRRRGKRCQSWRTGGVCTRYRGEGGKFQGGLDAQLRWPMPRRGGETCAVEGERRAGFGYMQVC